MQSRQYTPKKNMSSIPDNVGKGKAQFVDNRASSVFQRKQIDVMQRAAILLLSPIELLDKKRPNDLMQATARLGSQGPILGAVINRIGGVGPLFPLAQGEVQVGNNDNIDIMGHSYRNTNPQGNLDFNAPGNLDSNTLAQLICDLNFADKTQWQGAVRIFSCSTGLVTNSGSDYQLNLITTLQRSLPMIQKILASKEPVVHLPMAPPIMDGSLRILESTSIPSKFLINEKLFFRPLIDTNVKIPAYSIPESVYRDANRRVHNIMIVKCNKIKENIETIFEGINSQQNPSYFATDIEDFNTLCKRIKLANAFNFDKAKKTRLDKHIENLNNLLLNLDTFNQSLNQKKKIFDSLPVLEQYRRFTAKRVENWQLHPASDTVLPHTYVRPSLAHPSVPRQRGVSNNNPPIIRPLTRASRLILEQV